MNTNTSFPPSEPVVFAKVDDFIESAQSMLEARETAYSKGEARETELLKLHMAFSDPNDRGYKKALLAQQQLKARQLCLGKQRIKAWTKYWHLSVSLSVNALPLCRQFAKYRLNRFERETIAVLLLGELRLIESNRGANDVEWVMKNLHIPTKQHIRFMRYLGENGRLYRNGLVGYTDDEEALPRRDLLLDPSVAESVLSEQDVTVVGWPVKTEAQLYSYLNRLTNALKSKGDEVDSVIRGCGFAKDDVYKWSRKANYLLNGLDTTLELRRNWNLAKVQLGRSDLIIFLALMGKELGHIPEDDDFFKGAGLVRPLIRSLATPGAEAQGHMQLLRSASILRRKDWIQPCGGVQALLSDDINELEGAEFELSEKAVKFLGIDPKTKQKRRTGGHIRKPRVKFNDLVLHERAREALALATAQAENSDTLFIQWGLGEKLSYGRGISLLFSGPPGTGKTASAEALAHALGKDLLVADYAKLQNCFVGQTEKNISGIFREAREADTVLFWDEADAMFFDRDSASRNWEVRDVNVLLQELERFDGVCILATNRKVTLDKALERRITLKIEFENPDRDMREAIFKRLIPKKMPLSNDIDFKALAQHELSGGEIKNVVLNAARIGLQRMNGDKGHITMNDFQRAVELGKSGAWSIKNPPKIGFKKTID